MSEIEKMDLSSLDVVDERLQRMRELFPEVFSESGIDFEKLRLELGDEVDDGDERYAFTWPGKRDAIRQSQTVSTATLRPCVEGSRGRDGEDGSFDSDNLYIEGDNLEVLKLLQRAYHGKVKMIYIDPPYNTGHDFVYKDKFGDSIENYKEQASLTNQSNADTSGRFHSDWCSMMYPRLKLARELLREDGVIFISIDDNEVKNALNICSEIFGENNFIEIFVWEKTQHFGRQKLNAYSNADYILCYAKQLASPRLRELLVERIKTDLLDAPLYNASNNLNTLTFPAKTVKFNLKDGIYENTTSSDYQLLNPVSIVNGRNDNDFNLRFRSRWSNSTVQEEIAKGTTFWVKTQNFAIRAIYGEGKTTREAPRQMFFTNQSNPSKTLSRYGNRIDTSENATKELSSLVGDVFSYPKPSTLIEYLISLLWQEDASDKGDGLFSEDGIILDFFSGSGTTAHAVMNANASDGGSRKYILVQLPEEVDSAEFTNLCEIGEERIRRSGDRLKSDLSQVNQQLALEGQGKQLPDIGFRVFKLDESGIRKPEEGQLLIDRIKSDRTDLDIIFEMMLRWGLELTYPVEEDEICGYPVYSVAYDELICCMKPGITVEVLEGIAAREPRRVFLLDSAIDDTVKLNALQIFKRVEERTQQKIDLRTV